MFTNDVDRAREVAGQLRAGTVGHNAFRTDFGIAFGGFKQSGIGHAVRFGTAWHPINPDGAWLQHTGAARPAPGEPARRRRTARHRAPDQVPAAAAPSPALAGRSASVRSPRSPRTSGSSPD